MEKNFKEGLEVGLGSGLWSFLFERFATSCRFIWRNRDLICGLDAELRRLHFSFLKIQSLVENTGEDNIFEWSGAWKAWFHAVRELGIDFDIFMDNMDLQLSAEKTSFSTVICSFDHFITPFKLETLQQRLDKLINEMQSLMLIDKMISRRSRSSLLPYCGSTPYLVGHALVGRGANISSIVDFLNSETSPYEVIPIVGMGGIGKTAVARAVYNDDRLSFFRRVWVYVGAQFDAIEITKSVIEQLTSQPCHMSDLSSLQAKVQHLLSSGKHLIVLDNVWVESYEDWDMFSSPFGICPNGNKVIVTTRSLKVALVVSSWKGHILDLLSDDDCWELIRRKALVRVDDQELKPIGLKISQRCKGLSLIATSFGYSLRGKSTAADWEYILEGELDKDIFRSMIKSYLNLPPHLRRCFSYCAVFPEDYMFDRDELVLLWMAQGFVGAVGSRRLEDVGREYFDDLYLRCLFQRDTDSPSCTVYKMHGIIHDMARLVDGDACLHTSDSSSLFGRFFHLRLVHRSPQTLELEASRTNNRLRSFWVVCSNAGNTEVKIDKNLFIKCKSLRVLGLRNLGLSELPSSFEDLNLLRYLDVSENPIISLPDSICKFVALQTLKLVNCQKLRVLPEDMKNLKNLRHLELCEDCDLHYMPSDFGELTGLETLNLFVVGPTRQRGINQLGEMVGLLGSLCISKLDGVSNDVHAGEAGLGMKEFLKTLELWWTKMEAGSSQLDFQRTTQPFVLGNLKPHENLEVLVIKNYIGMSFPSWLSESSRRFTKIHLIGLEYCHTLPCLGGLECLRMFSMEDMPSLWDIDDAFYGTSEVKFPALSSFILRNLVALTHWRSVNNNAMPGLTGFTITNCPNLVSLPPRLHSVRANSEIHGCPLLQDVLP